MRLPTGSSRIHSLRHVGRIWQKTFLLRDMNYSSIVEEKHTKLNGTRPNDEFVRALVAIHNQSIGFLAKNKFC
jgi:hypothetical protein